MGKEFGDLKNRHSDTINIIPSDDPATMIVNMINNEEEKMVNNLVTSSVKIDVSMSSNLNSKMMMFFRHHNSLVILMMIMIFMMLIKVSSTSKVDNLYNLKEFLKMLVMCGVMFVLSVQPMMIIMSLIFSVLMYSLFMYWNLSSFWFSYMMILVLLSGVLVVFTYMVSILPNESFEISSLVLLVFSFVFIYKNMFYSEFFQDFSLGSNMIWWSISLLMSLFLVLYLLFIMLMLVWISMMEHGAIRIS